MRVLVIGAGGREHALVDVLARSREVVEVFCLPGSDAIAAQARCLPGDMMDAETVREAVSTHRVDLVVVGPEAPLAAGLADRLTAASIPVFGPGRQAARLESSKSHAKAFMERHGIPTARSRTFDDPGEAEDHVRRQGGPVVVKADGLAAGKGVTVAATVEEALRAVSEAMRRGRFGPAGRRVVIEECLSGPEVSVMAFTDGEALLVCPPAQDHKAVGEGGTGPNTGGMGAYSPVPLLDAGTLAGIERDILRPTVAGLAAEGTPYRGVLYAGLMLTADGPKVLEFNCRFGDPEAQVILPRLAGDFGVVAAGCAAGTLSPEGVGWSAQAAVCVVLCSGGYPGAYETGLPISGLERAAQMAGVRLYHAGTTREPGEGRWLTAGGRVLGVTGLAGSLAAARERAYQAVKRITFQGMHYRGDIGAEGISLQDP